MKRRVWANEFVNISDRKFKHDQNPGVQIIKNGFVLPLKSTSNSRFLGGICDSEKNFVAGLQRGKENGKYPFDIYSSYEFDEDNVDFYDEEVVFGGAVISHFGEFLIDGMTRFWYLIENIKVKSRKIIFLKCQSQMPKWFYSIIDLLGIPSDNIVVLEHITRFKIIIVPDEAAHLQSGFSEEFLKPFDYMRNNVPPSCHKRLYLTHRTVNSTSNQVVVNERYFERFFQDHGYITISPEKYDIKEQISLLAGAEEIISLYGTLSHLALFCKNNIKWTMLTRVKKTVLVAQSVINEARNIDWSIVDVSMNFLFESHSPGVCLIGESYAWREWVFDTYNEIINTTTWKEATLEYVRQFSRMWNKDDKKYFIKDRYSVDNMLDLMQSFFDLYAVDEDKYGIFRNFNRPFLCYKTHLAIYGWSEVAYENEISGRMTESRDMQAIIIYAIPRIYKIFASVCYKNGQWGEWVSDGMAGTTGKRLPIYGIKLLCDELLRSRYSVGYRMHVISGAWSEWVYDGFELANAEKPMNAIQVKLVEKRNVSAR